MERTDIKAISSKEEKRAYIKMASILCHICANSRYFISFNLQRIPMKIPFPAFLDIKDQALGKLDNLPRFTLSWNSDQV